jgi:RimJ/RimL family protein N-acetyltransferase
MVIRTFTDADVEPLSALHADPDVMRFITDGVPMTYEKVRDEVLPRFIGYEQRHPGLGIFAAIRKDTGAFIGWFQLQIHENDPKELELGYRFMRDCWGQGYATEGSRALLKVAFAERGAERVVAGAMKANRGSIRVMEKAGLTFEKDFEEHDFPGENKDAVLYSITRESYETNDHS